jgi:flagellar hook-associated protein 2
MGERITFTGLSSGIDFQAIVDATILAEQRRINLVLVTRAEETAKLAAVQSFNGLLLGLLTSVSSLSRQNDFLSQSATSSHESLVSAQVAGNAALGTHALTINALAQAHQLASQGFADTDLTGVGLGDITIRVGSGATTTIEVDAGNNTLEGLRDAINNSDAEVTATIINDGSASNPYRLLLSAEQTGAANTINIGLNLAGGTPPDFFSNNIDSVEVNPGNNPLYTGIASSLGAYTGNSNLSFIVEIMSGGISGAATFRYSTDGGTTFNDNGGAGFLTSDLGTLMEDGVSIAFSDSGTFSAGDRFSIDVFVPTTQVAQDASITLGSAEGGGAPITISSASNTLTQLIPGVTLNLLGADPATTVRITVANDTEAVTAAVEGFVAAYNGVIDFMNDQLRYDPLLETGGILLGDSMLITVQNDIRRIATDVVAGLPADLNRLSTVGITSVPETGRLILDSGALREALESDPQGVVNLFTISFSTTDPDIVFLNSTSKTVVTADGFTIDITQAATKGTLEGSMIGAFPLTLTGSNNELSFVIDGVESSILTLPERTYTTGDELALEIQAQLNADPKLAGRDVRVEFTGGRLRFTSSSYGSFSEVTLGAAPGNSAFAALGLSGAVSMSGKDVAGTINGESATGRGQILTGEAGNATSDGLALLVTLTTEEINDTEPEGVISLTEGIAARMRDRLEALTDPIDGRLVNRADTLTRKIEDLDADVERMKGLLEAKRLSLLNEYARLEASLAVLSSQGDFLLQQLAALPLMNSNRN